MTDIKKLDDMLEGKARQPSGSSKDQEIGLKKKRNPMQVQEGVGRNKKVAKVPRTQSKPKTASESEKEETVAEQSADSNSRIRITSVKVKEPTYQSEKKPPTPESSGGVDRYTTLSPPKAPSVSEPPEPSPKQSKDEYARAMALYKAEEEWKHKMGDFDRLPNDGGRNRAYESKCVKCDKRAIAKVQYPENYSDAQGVPGWHGNATEGPCHPKPRRKPVTKTDANTRSDPKLGRVSSSRQTGVKPSSRADGVSRPRKATTHSHGSSRRSIKSNRFEKDIRKRFQKTPVELKIAKPSRERILGDKARDEARREAKEKGHRISEFILFAYPEIEGYIVYRGRCEKCRRTALGMVKQHSDEAGKSGSIVVSGDALEHRCSVVGAKR